MNVDMTPFNISLLSNKRERLGTLLPVQSMDIYDGEGGYHPQGLYSTQIFGRIGDPNRLKRHSFCDMKTEIMHPKIYMELTRLKNLYAGILSGSAYAAWDANIKDFVKSDILDGNTGYSFFMSHFAEIAFKRNESSERDLRIDLIEKYRSDCMYRYLVILPAGLREPEIDEGGRLVEDELNAIYRKILRISNTIPAGARDYNNPMLDAQRWSLQQAFNQIDEYFVSFLSGKHGFLLSRYAARAVAYGTRNIITAMDPAPARALAKGGVTINHTICGLHQAMKGLLDLTIFHVRNGPAKSLIASIPGDVPVVDRKTLKRIMVKPSAKTIEKWGSSDGLEELINGFEQFEIRHNPVIIDGHYLALTYNDGSSVKVLESIDDLGELDRKFVSPMTWVEFWYLSTATMYEGAAAFVTRYPIAELGSTYPSIPYVMTTQTGQVLKDLTDPNITYYQFPKKGVPFYESMSVHITKAARLGADNDGDKCSMNFVWGKESLDEIHASFQDPAFYLTPNGTLSFGIRDEHIANDVLQNMTYGARDLN